MKIVSSTEPLKAKISSLSETLNQTKENISSKEFENVKLRKSVAILNKKSLNDTKSMATNIDQIDNLKNSAAIYKSRIKDLELNIAEAKSLNIRLKKLLQTELKEKSAANKNSRIFQEKIEKLQETIPEQITKAKLSLTKRVSTLESELAQVEKSNLEKDTTIKSLKKANTSTRKSLFASENDITMITESLEDLKSAFSRSQQELSASKTKVAKLETRSSRLIKELSSSKSNYMVSTAEAVKLKDKLSSFEQSLPSKIASAQSKLKERINDLIKNNADLKIATKSLVADQKAPLEKQIAILQKELKTATVFNNRKTDEISNLQQYSTQSATNLASAEKDIKSLNSLIEDLKDVLGKTSFDLKQTKEQLNIVEVNKNNLIKQLSLSQSEKYSSENIIKNKSLLSQGSKIQ